MRLLCVGLTLDVSFAAHRPIHSTYKERRFFVLLNPFSGQKKALKLWEKDCRPLLDEAGINYTIKYSVNLMQKLALDHYVGVVVLSGDGMVNEVLTGLTTRSDRDRALKMPILHVPAGTSNALAAAVAFQSGEPFTPRGNFCREMTLMAVQPAYRPLRLYHVETAKDGHKLMFLDAVWGLIADIDLGSERFRWAGMIRLHMEAFIRIARLPQLARYKGRISYKPVNDLKLLRHTRLKSDLVREKLGTDYFQTASVPEFEADTVTEGPVKGISEAFKDTNFPCLNEPVPHDWEVVEGEFAFVCLSAISHIGSDLPYCPSARLDEEVMYLSLVDWRTIKSRFHIAQLLLTIDKSLHLDHECFQVSGVRFNTVVQMIPVLACRVEPAEGVGGYVAIDGEPVTSGSAFQVNSTSLTGTVIGRDGQFN